MNRKENVINKIHWLEEALDLNITSFDEEISSSDEATSSEIETNKSSINWEFKYAITETSKESTSEITEAFSCVIELRNEWYKLTSDDKPKKEDEEGEKN